MYEKEIAAAAEHFKALLARQLERNEAIRSQGDFIDYAKLDKIVIGVCGGDGIGPIITAQSADVLAYLLKDDVAKGRIEFKQIDGLTIENRIAHMQPIPDDVLAALKSCHVILKGPTTTPQAGDGRPNIESANVAMRKALDLFANVRPVRIPEEGIDWTFFRENTEGEYVLGSRGIEIPGALTMDFKVTTEPGTRRIARMAFNYAKNNGKDSVAIVTKANIMKKTDGRFSEICHEVAEDYPGIGAEDWYADIVTAKLVDEKTRGRFQVFVLPNLYGDIITDEAAQIQGGVGTAGSANIGDQYAMFEAIHGSAPRMVEEGRGDYADPCSMLRAGAMLLSHIGYVKESQALDSALDICMASDEYKITGRSDGCTCAEFGAFVKKTLYEIMDGAAI